VSIISSSFSAIGRLTAVALLAAAFLFGMAGVVYMSLQGQEVKVPEIIGKDLSDSEKELASLGLKIKKRADRFSQENPGTIIEQLPKAGDTVKTGQMILVVTSKGPGEGDLPASLKKTTDEDDTEKIEEMISDKPKKPKSNSNANIKKADTTRDVNTATTNSNSETDSNTNSNSSDPASNKKDPSAVNTSSDKPKANTQTTPPRLPNPVTKPAEVKPKQPVKP
jgi:hypothetical protein